MKNKLSFLIRMVLPSVMAVLSDLVELLKGITPAYVDKVIDWVWKEFIGGLIEIKTDNIPNDKEQIKYLWQDKKQSFFFVMLRAANEAGLEWSNENLEKFPKLQFALREYFSFGIRLVDRLEQGEINEEAETRIVEDLEVVKKKLL